jgi:acyl-CoA dehydrogenase
MSMDSHSETGQIIEATARKVLSAHSAADRLKAAEGSWNAALWSELEASGLTRALEPPEQAELGVPVAEALQIVRLAGQYSAQVPLVESLFAHWLIKASGLPAGEGPLTVAPTNSEDRLVLRRTHTGWHLSGRATRVPWARYATAVVVSAGFEGRDYLVLAPSTSFSELVHGENLARDPRDRIDFDAEVAENAAVPFELSREYLYGMGAGLRVVQMAGALDAVLDLTVRYVQERKQFGRALGKFQAVQQNIAVMAANTAAAGAAANSVVRLLAGRGPLLGFAAAKVRAGESVTLATKLAHQAHGAMGFTQEYGLHFLTKRLWAWRDEFGNEVFWSRKLGRAACDHGQAGLWAFVTSAMSS